MLIKLDVPTYKICFSKIYLSILTFKFITSYKNDFIYIYIYKVFYFEQS